MTAEEQACLRLGREVARMIHDVRKASGSYVSYARRKFTFPGGSVEILLTNDSNLATVMELAVKEGYAVESITPPSERN